MNRKKVNNKKDVNYLFYLLSFFDLGGYDLHIGPLLGNPLLNPLQEVAAAGPGLVDDRKGEDRLAGDVLKIRLDGGDIEALPNPGEDALHNPPLSL